MLFEEVTKIFLVSNQTLADLSLKILCSLYKARDKARLTFREWVTRVLTNLILFLDCV
jgi:hypothetical protein